MGMARGETKGYAAIDDILPQAEGDVGYTILRLLIPDRIEVEGAGDARNRRIKVGAIAVSDYFLQNDRHLLLIDKVRRGSHIRLAVAIEDGGVNSLDSIADRAQHLVFFVDFGYHIR